MSARTVLVTGAGGLLGGEVAGVLAARGWAVRAMVHRRPEVLRNDGSPAPVRAVVSGDVTAERFGWDADTWGAAARSHGLIVHCAAETAFGAPAERAHAVNVGGTGRVLALAAAGGAGLLHVSTAFVNGDRDAPVREADPPGGGYANAYEASKAEAEALVRGSGVRHAVARPGIVVGDWATGRIRQFDTFYQVLKALGEGWITALPVRDGASLHLVPIDHVAVGIADLADRFDAVAGRCFHLVAAAPTPMAAFPATLSRYPGMAVPTLLPPAAFAHGSEAEARRFARVMAPYAPYFSRSPAFDAAGFEAATGRASPAPGPAWWGRLVDYALASGFLRPLPGSRQASRIRPNGIRNEAATPSSAGSR